MGHDTTSIFSLMIVTFVAFFIPILLQRLKLKAIPIVAAEIISGIIIGKSGLNLVDVHNSWLSLLSTLGLIFLMFLSGLEIDFEALKVRNDKKPRKTKQLNPLFISIVIFALMLLFSYCLSMVLVIFELIDDAFFMTIILSTISLGIVVPVLKERKVINTELGQIVLLIAVISDFLTMILFTYYLAYKNGDTKIVWWILLLLGFVILLYYFLDHFKNKRNFDLLNTLKRGTAQIGTRGVFALILLFVALSETIDVENILGAFLAGVVVSLLSPDREFVHQLDSFGYGFLIPIFFVMVGVEFDVKSLLENPNIILLIPIVLLFLFLSRIVPTLLMKPWFSWKETIGSGVLLTSTLSLAIVAATVSMQLGIISEGMSSAIILVSILTCFVSPILYSKISPEVKNRKNRLAIIGANRSALRAGITFQKSDYAVTVISKKQEKIDFDDDNNNEFQIIELDELSLDQLIEMNVFQDFDRIIVATRNDYFNAEVADYAKDIGYNNIIVRLEDPALNKKYSDMGILVFSYTFSAEMILKVMVHSPSLVKFLSDEDEVIRELILDNEDLVGLAIRELPFLGDILILSIYRGTRCITPSGNIILQKGDRLIMSGSEESMEKITNYFI